MTAVTATFKLAISLLWISH